MGYRTVFEASIGIPLGIPIGAFLLGLGALALAVFLLRKAREAAHPVNTIIALVGAFFLIWGSGVCLGSAVIANGELGDRKFVREAFKHHDYQVVEGEIVDFSPLPASGHAYESFAVAGKRFRYGTGWGSVFFNAAHNDGSLRNGVIARVTYRDQNILRIETKQ